jgi:hypothetical protein
VHQTWSGRTTLNYQTDETDEIGEMHQSSHGRLYASAHASTYDALQNMVYKSAHHHQVSDIPQGHGQLYSSATAGLVHAGSGATHHANGLTLHNNGITTTADDHLVLGDYHLNTSTDVARRDDIVDDTMMKMYDSSHMGARAAHANMAHNNNNNNSNRHGLQLNTSNLEHSSIECPEDFMPSGSRTPDLIEWKCLKTKSSALPLRWKQHAQLRIAADGLVWMQVWAFCSCCMRMWLSVST